MLYSFRRCPYAIRVRYTLAFLNVSVYLREVILKAKPDALLSLGGRSTVPQLIDVDGARYAESSDIIFWALSKSSIKNRSQQLWPSEIKQRNNMQAWIAYNDHFFKYWLDRYKYADRYPDFSEVYYRSKGEIFLQRLENRLKKRSYLFGESETLPDIMIFPFVRQFVAVNQSWFDISQYNNVKVWLARFINSALFQSVVMIKHSAWQAGQAEVPFPA
ncbi:MULTISPECIES: glutathione S-transferase [Marinomonas]|uniref:Glutathione S-transferase n=1 Tax=Marinomonas rhodophyticola TaxID=2992803 RepID=A0ABT3KEM1_9GAMM|nr:glutathione S-transferase [Marinomonas sp. KJ51-3]MCW4628993.1 glutathione S-transferase [Marinomonas sp. KJ51-3]